MSRLGGDQVEGQPAKVALLEWPTRVAGSAALRPAELPTESHSLAAPHVATPAAVTSIFSPHVLTSVLEINEIRRLVGRLAQKTPRIQTFVMLSEVANQTAESRHAPPPSGSGPAEMAMSLLRSGLRIAGFGAFTVEFIFDHVDLAFLKCEMLRNTSPASSL
jgi:hypothetical protein